MKLYYSKGACSLAVRILINELGLACEFEAVDLRTKKTETGQDFLTINPKGAVPALVLEDGKVLTENAVIHQYLAELKAAEHLLPPPGDFARYRVLEWLNYVATEMHKGCSPLFNPTVPQETKETVFIPLLKKKIEYLNHHLQNNAYLSGDHYTLPDGYLLTVLRWLAHFNITLDGTPHLKRYHDRLQERKSIALSLQQEGLK